MSGSESETSLTENVVCIVWLMTSSLYRTALTNCYWNLRLVIAGKVQRLDKLTNYTPRSSSRINYLGLISKEDVLTWCQIANLTILPSYSEQCSYSGMEYLAYGKIVITTDGYGLTEMFNDKNAIICHLQSSSKTRTELPSLQEQLSEKIIQYLTMNDETILRLKSEAKRTFTDKYTFESMRKNYLYFLHNIQ